MRRFGDFPLRAPELEAEISQAASGPVLNILLVDDEPANLLALEAILEPLKQNLVRATSGKEALRHALKDDYAVILLDVQMPEMDGFEAAQLLRKRTRTRDVPIIFLTAISKDRNFVTKGYGVGAVDYLFKPYEPDVLRAKVAVFAELARKNEIIRAQHRALKVLSERELADVKRQSDQRYADLADAMPLLVWTTNPAGHLMYGNARWAELARGSRDLEAVIAEDDRARFREGWAAALAAGTEWEAELRFGNSEVGHRTHLLRVVPHRDEAGAIASWVGTSTDIDARVRAEGSLRLLAEASRRLGSMLGDPVAIESVLSSALPVLGDLARLDLIDAPDATRLDATPERVKASAGALPMSLLEDPRFDMGPSTVAYSGRSEVYLDVDAELGEAASSHGAANLRFLGDLGVSAYMCVPLVSRERPLGTLTLVRAGGSGTYAPADVALAENLATRIAIAIDNARLHETTEKRREELERANQSKDVFLATLSHELRTPLNAIVGWTDMLRTGQLAPEELGRAIETIDRNAHSLNRLVADLLDVSRIVTGSLKLDSKHVPLAAVVEAAVEATRPQCAAKHVAMDVSLERVGCVKGDAGRLKQVLGNLLSNAVKFTPSGGTIIVRVARDSADGKSSTVVVKDSGEGIAPDFLPHVFERFRQAENAKARGLGLGLAIVKHLVEEHGGSICASSDGLGKGAEFTLTLPIAADESAAEDIDGARPSVPPSVLPELAGVHALVVEDDPDGNELITTILERYGARVTSVGTAAAAIDALDTERPDILVSDIGLPDSDGLELIKLVRSRASELTLPAIALTAYASRQDAAKALSAGFDAHVAKPVQPGTLGSAVARLVAGGRESVRSAQPVA